MERLQVYERLINAWSDRYTLQSGFSESWVLDKTTDSAKDIKVIYNSISAPAWAVNDWVRILHIETADEAASYNADGTPLNHNQYIISGIQSVKNAALEYWTVSMTLAEPIERFNGIVGEVLAYTNQTEKSVFDPISDTTTVYIKERYNHLTALERWLKLTPANCDNYGAGYNKNNNTSWYNRIRFNANDSALLASLPFGDQTLNGRNLYELMLDVYDNSVGRTPVAYFDIDSTTDLPYNPARDEYYIRFERQDGFDKAVIPLAELQANCKNEAQTKEDNTTGIYSDIENMAVLNNVELPSQRLYLIPEVDSNNRSTEDYDATLTDNWVLKTPYLIKNVIKIVKLRLASRVTTVGETKTYANTALETDLTASTYEEKEYNALVPDPKDNEDIIKYTEGSNKLIIRGYKYIGFCGDNDGLLYYIEYQPLLNPRVLIGNAEHTESINQTDGQVDSDKYAQFLNQYLNGKNKADLVIIKTYDDYYSFDEHIGSRVTDGGKIYMITAVSYINRNYQYDVVYQLNENHFRKNNNYQAETEIRKNIAIPYKDIQERKSVLKQSISLGLTAQSNTLNTISFDKRTALSALAPAKVSAEQYPQIALIKAESALNIQGGGTESYALWRVATIAKCAFGNQCHLHYKFFDNAEAGKSKTAEPKAGATGQIVNWITRVESQLPTIYTDFFGEIEKITTYIANVNDEDLSNIDDDVEQRHEKIVAFYNKMLNFPKVTEAQRNELIAKAVATVTNQQILKDQLEQLNENYIIELVSADMTICPALINKSRLLRPTDDHEMQLIFCNREMAANDIISSAQVSARSITKANTTQSANNVTYSFTPYTGVYSSIIVATNANEPLLIINKTINSIENGIFVIYY